MQVKVLIARFPFGNSEAPSVTDWLVPTIMKMKHDTRISEIFHMNVDDTPITMSRNRVLKAAIQRGADFVVMVDSDMRPDLPLPYSKPFWPTAFDFALKHAGPCCVAAPYCGAPPHENVFIFRWATQQSDHPNADIKLEQYTREEAAMRVGFEEAGALPTGLILIDMRGVKLLEAKPWFDYEWADAPYNTEKATTEDVYFTRNLSLIGVPQYVLWDSWAGHWKRKCVMKPGLLTADQVRAEFHGAIARGNKCNERILEMRNGQPLGHPDEKRPMESLA